MKIAMIISTPFPPEEGIGVHVYNLSKSLIKRGHEVSVFTRSGLKFEKDCYDNIKIIRVPFIPLYPFHVHIHGWFFKMLNKRIEENFDIIHLHNPLVPFINVNLPIITTIHGSMVENVNAMELVDLKSLCSKILGTTVSYKISKKLMESSEKVLIVSESVAQQIKKYYNFDNFEVIYNGVDINKFYTKKGDNNYLLYVGRLGHGKGIFDLLDTAKMLAKINDIKLLIAGKGELKGKICNKIKNENLNNVKLLGHVNQDDLIKIYQNAKLFVFPSHYEGLPTAILEAMACGLPIITTSVSGCKDLINDGHNGILVPPKDPKKLFDALHYLLNNGNFAEYLGKNARLTVEEKYSWEVISEQVETIYSSVLNKEINISRE